MKTNRFLSIVMMFFVIFGTVAFFSSCGNDDEILPEKTDEKDKEDEELEDVSPIIGTWSSLEYEGDEVILYQRYTFDSDNTFTLLIYEGETYKNKTINGLWEYDVIAKKLRLTHDGITDAYTVDMQKDMLTLFQGKIVGTYDKEVKTAIVGTWKYSFGSGYSQLTFYDNGTGMYYEDDKSGKDDDEGREIDKEVFYYKYDATNKYLILIYEDDPNDDWDLETSYLTWISENAFISDIADYNSTWIKQ